MKKGLVVLLLIMLIPIVSAVPADPRPYPCEPGSKVLCTDEGDHNYVESFTLDTQGEPDCPVVFNPTSKKPSYAVPDEEGYLVPTPTFLSDLDPEDAAQTEQINCGDDFRAVRAIRPPPPVRPWDEVVPIGRQAANAEQGIGVEVTEEGTYEFVDPTSEDVAAIVVPPRLQEPAPIIEITGQATKFTANFKPQVVNVVVILVQFPDQPAKVAASEIQQKFFGPGGLQEYLESQSYGAYKVQGRVIPTWYTLPQSMGFYGGNFEANIEQMIAGAVDLANPDVDFTQFDGNGDRVVDAFFVVHAGEPDESGGGNGDEIWSHYYSISPKVVDTVQVIDYETVSEDSPIGIIAHEFGHYLGLPDFYDTVYDDGSSKGTGEWSIMGYGGYLDDVGSFDPWSKGYLGWLNDENLGEITEDGLYDLVQDDATVGTRYYLMSLSPTELYMIENRHRHELMNGDDAGGILVWHIDESKITETGSFNGCVGTRWDCNAVNGDANHKLVDVEEADGKEDLDKNKLGDKKDTWVAKCSTFGGGCKSVSFDSTSRPSSISYRPSPNDIALAINSPISSRIQVGISLAGSLLEPAASDEEAIVEEVIDPVTGEVTKRTVKSSTGGGPGKTILIIVFVVLILVGGGLTLFFLLRKKAGSIHPGKFRQFNR